MEREMNLLDVFLIIILAVVLGTAVWVYISSQRKGNGCGCGCAGCSRKSCDAAEDRKRGQL
jgi:hypothetical protein